jgi:hypothetical protein
MNVALAVLLSIQMSAGSACELARRQILPVLHDLFEVSHTAAKETERGGFLQRDADGALDLVLWPATMQRRKAEFRGTRPPNTVAIAHTHPSGMPLPSEHDINEAERVGLPIYVVTRTSIARVNPDRTVTPIVSQDDWFARPERIRDVCQAWG